MHFADPISCVPITICYGGTEGINAAAPKLDDITAFAELYPAAGGNPQPTGGIWGNVYFTEASGNVAQMMQGVNVVARLMVNGQPSRQYVVTSVSGYSFIGNAGNIITGYLDANGLPFNRWGSSDPSVEGTYNLGQLIIPTGQTTAQYQLSVEAVDPNWSTGVGPYSPTQVEPSGSFAPVVVTVTSGVTAERDVLMAGSEVAQTHPGSGSTYQTPAPLPLAGGWGSWISGYGSADFFEFTAQANRTASFAVTAFDESGNPTESKLLPVIGIWELSDQSGDPAPASTPSAFNSMTFGMTRLDALFNDTEAYRVGIADYRGDGRPDYFYQASVLYSDTVTPARLSLAGGVTALQGLGFQQGLQVSAGGVGGTMLTQSANQMQVALPAAAQDGTATIQVTNPVSGSFSRMIGAIDLWCSGIGSSFSAARVGARDSCGNAGRELDSHPSNDVRRCHAGSGRDHGLELHQRCPILGMRRRNLLFGAERCCGGSFNRRYSNRGWLRHNHRTVGARILFTRADAADLGGGNLFGAQPCLALTHALDRAGSDARRSPDG